MFFLWLFSYGKYISELLHLAFPAEGLERQPGDNFSLLSYLRKGVEVSAPGPRWWAVP